MDSTEILLTVKDFEARYGIARSNVYNRLNGLSKKGYDMAPMKQGTKAIYSASQGALMDQLHEHLEAGNDIGSFVDVTGRVELSQPIGRSIEHPIERPATSQDSMIERSPSSLSVAALVDAIAGKLVTLSPAPTVDPLANLRQLEEAYEKGWLLSSSQLGSLLGFKSFTGASFERYGFTFTRQGKNGAESAWKISKT